MKKKVVLKCLRTPKNYYVYDRSCNSMVRVSEKDYEEFRQIESGKLAPENSSSLKKYQINGLFQENEVERIYHPEADYLEHLSNTNLGHLVLQVTQQCNLRCDYCIYSGKYNNRSHSDKRMTFSIAKKAIDFFVERTRESKQIVLGFYGGEPFLELPLMVECITYIKSIAGDKELGIGLTTNGTLLTDQAIDFLVENDVQAMISLDGNKKEHDANRRFAESNKGTFDVIIKNVKKIKEKYPDYYKKSISFNTVINPKSDILCTQEYFSAEELFSDSTLMFNVLDDLNMEDVSGANYIENFWLPRSYEYLKLLLFLIGRIKDRNKLSPLIRGAHVQDDDLYKTLQQHIPTGKTAHHGGPCLPGIRRLFVSTDGQLYPCERVTEKVDQMCIGNLDDGFDMEKMKFLLCNGQLTEKECINCWNLNNCMICLGEVDLHGGNKVTRELKLETCEKSKARTYAALRELCVLDEFGYKPENKREMIP